MSFHSVRSIGGCPVCLNVDWCSFADDSTSNIRLLVCRRLETSESIKQTKDGGWLYKLPIDSTKIVFSEVEQNKIAPVSRRHKVYSKMLELSKLNNIDKGSLYSRGLIGEEIKFFGYKSCEDIAEKLILHGMNLSMIPGFYFENSIWKMNIHEGFMIPCLNDKGQVQALQIRKRTSEKVKAKYVWFSSRNQKDNHGCSPGASIHTRIFDDERTVYIIEGILKADIAWLKLEPQNIIAIPGVGIGHNDVSLLVKKHRFERAIICFDGNWRTNDSVLFQLKKLGNILSKDSGAEVDIMTWDSLCGIDEAFQLNLETRIDSFNEWLSHSL